MAIRARAGAAAQRRRRRSTVVAKKALLQQHSASSPGRARSSGCRGRRGRPGSRSACREAELRGAAVHLADEAGRVPATPVGERRRGVVGARSSSAAQQVADRHPLAGAQADHRLGGAARYGTAVKTSSRSARSSVSSAVMSFVVLAIGRSARGVLPVQHVAGPRVDQDRGGAARLRSVARPPRRGTPTSSAAASGRDQRPAWSRHSRSLMFWPETRACGSSTGLSVLQPLDRDPDLPRRCRASMSPGLAPCRSLPVTARSRWSSSHRVVGHVSILLLRAAAAVAGSASSVPERGDDDEDREDERDQRRSAPAGARGCCVRRSISKRIG